VSEQVLVSACLLGVHCRHDARHCLDGPLERELARHGFEAVPFCPEEHGGLSTPRPSSWIDRKSADDVLEGRDRVVAKTGADVTAEFVKGAEGALAVCKLHGITRAFLKERSPSCGTCHTHVDGKLVEGPGVTTALLQRHGITVTRIEGRRE
jgi:uncharacterized protein YbbK (DUF523 family)